MNISGATKSLNMKRALVCGISGQDGAYLAQLLLSKGYEVAGTSRDGQISNAHNLHRLGIHDRVRLESMALNDFQSVLQTIVSIQPDEIYNLAGQSSVAMSFQQPVETVESIIVGTLNLLEAIRLSGYPIRFYNAGSSECFGEYQGTPANETTAFRPRSPYAVAKAAAFWEVANYREAYGLFASSGVLFNHESPLRSERFVTKKIVSAACRIAGGSEERLSLGNLSIKRDWGWAPEYVFAMWRILQHEEADDFIVATGLTTSLEEFTASAFSYFDLDWRDHVVIDQTLLRPTDLKVSRANPEKVAKALKWQATYKMADVVRMMIEAELNRIGMNRPGNRGD
jgi:GDPmannose 4,6-dehydratase